MISINYTDNDGNFLGMDFDEIEDAATFISELINAKYDFSVMRR